MIEQRELRARNDIDSLEAEFGKTLAELRAMVRTPQQLTNVCDRMEELASDGGQSNLFDQKIDPVHDALLEAITEIVSFGIVPRDID